MIVAILQARMTSSRLPGKVLKPLLNEPMLARQIERIQRCQTLDKFIVATSEDQSDNPIVDLCAKLGIHCFRGSLNDVLDRYYQAASAYDADHVVRLTGDCPLTDPKVIDNVVRLHLSSKTDYTSTCIQQTLPDGLDVQITTMDALKVAWENAKLPSEREHVTLYLRNHIERFVYANYCHSVDLSEKRWTVDEQEDFELVNRIYAELYPQKPDFDMYDILKVLEKNPDWEALNAHIGRDEGLVKSLREDLKVMSYV